MKKVLSMILVVALVLGMSAVTALAAGPPYNGIVDGTFIINPDTGAFTANLTGDFTCTITGFGWPDASDARITHFNGTMTGDIESSSNGVVGKINANGQDSIFAVISGTGASDSVYLMGDGKEFQNMKIVTGPLPDPVTDVVIGSVEGTTEVPVGGVLHMQLESITRTGSYPVGNYEYLWGVYVNYSDYAYIEQNGTLHILAMPPDGKITMMVNTLDPNVYTENLVITVVDPKTEVTAGVDPTYTIVIPASVDFGTLVKDGSTVTKAFDVKAQSVLIESGASIEVSAEGPFVMKDNDGAGSVPLAYTLRNSTVAVPAGGGTFTTFYGSRTEEGSVAVNTNDITAAGSYKGTMVFTITYND